MRIRTGELIRLIVLYFIIGSSVASVPYAAHIVSRDDNFMDCGVVESKSGKDIPIKHGSRTELYLNVNLEKQGFTSVLCEPTTYFEHDEGDYVCFSFNPDDTPMEVVTVVVGGLTALALASMALVKLLDFLFPGTID